MAPDPNAEPDSDAEDEALKAEGKVSVLIFYHTGCKHLMACS